MKFKPVKLELIHLFLLFLLFIIIAPMVTPLIEGLDSMGERNAERSKQDKITENMNADDELPDFKNKKWNDNNYMLKSQMVPPVCPACPSKCDNVREKPCPPCPPCERCPACELRKKGFDDAGIKDPLIVRTNDLTQVY